MTGGALELGLGGSDEGPRVNGDTACLTQKGAAKVRSKCLQKHCEKGYLLGYVFFPFNIINQIHRLTT